MWSTASRPARLSRDAGRRRNAQVQHGSCPPRRSRLGVCRDRCSRPGQGTRTVRFEPARRTVGLQVRRDARPVHQWKRVQPAGQPMHQRQQLLQRRELAPNLERVQHEPGPLHGQLMHGQTGSERASARPERPPWRCPSRDPSRAVRAADGRTARVQHEPWRNEQHERILLYLGRRPVAQRALFPDCF